MLERIDIHMGYGKIDGLPHYEDLTTLGNVLISGETGTGKTTWLKKMLAALDDEWISSLLPDVIIYDPKKCEYGNAFPHLKVQVYKGSSSLESFSACLDKLVTLSRQRIWGAPFVKQTIIIVDECYSLLSRKDILGKLINLSFKTRINGIHLFLISQTKETLEPFASYSHTYIQFRQHEERVLPIFAEKEFKSLNVGNYISFFSRADVYEEMFQTEITRKAADDGNL